MICSRICSRICLHSVLFSNRCRLAHAAQQKHAAHHYSLHKGSQETMILGEVLFLEDQTRVAPGTGLIVPVVTS